MTASGLEADNLDGGQEAAVGSMRALSAGVAWLGFAMLSTTVAAAQDVDPKVWIAGAESIGENWISYGDAAPANSDTGHGVASYFLNSLDYDRPHLGLISVDPEDNPTLADVSVLVTRDYLDRTLGLRPEPAQGPGDGRAFTLSGRVGAYERVYLVFRVENISLLIAAFAPPSNTAEPDLLSSLNEDVIHLAQVEAAFVASAVHPPDQIPEE